MTRFLLCLSLFAVAACASHESLPASDTNAHEALVPKDLYHKVLPAIYEVVVPKPDEKNVVYEKPLPVDRLPYRLRTDKYFSIGTAFAIGDNEFVSASHVLPIYIKTSATEFFIRDQEGHVYPVDQILRYSVYRDLVSFSVKQPPAGHGILGLAKQPEVGDTVFVIGNAQGEGISLRSGQVSSFTPEEVENKWKFIRFSAPASPGNSGGPLLNEKGEVVGIVARKNPSENLNYAIPIEEFSQLSPQKAEFIDRNQKFTRDAVEINKIWKFETPLPERISVVSEKAQKSMYESAEKEMGELYGPKDERFFPANKQFQEYARHQHTQNGIGVVAPAKIGNEWKTYFYKLIKTTIAEKEFVESYSNKNTYVFFVNKPKSVGRYAFASNPKLIFDQAAKGLDVHRLYLGEKIKILSLGEPDEKNQWKDDVGRTWVEGFWNIPASDTFVEMNCAPAPRGVVCLLNIMQSEMLSVAVRSTFKKALNTLVWSYMGTVDEWQEYLREDKALLPDSLQEASLQLHDGKLKVQVGDKGLVAGSGVSGASEVILYTRFTPELKTKNEVSSISVRPDKDQEVVYSQHWLWKPLDQGSDKAKETWNDVKNSRLKYDGKVHKDGKWNEVSLTGKSETRMGIPVYNYVRCSIGPDVADEKLPEHCREFLEANKAM